MQRMGSMFGAVGGLSFVQFNAGPFPPAVEMVLRVAAMVGFVVVLVLVASRRVAPSRAVANGRPGIGRGYGYVVAGEVVALVAGHVILSGPVDLPYAGPAWTTFVVGVHLLPMGAVFHEHFFVGLGVAIAVCGALGLYLAGLGTSQLSVNLVAGIVPGALLLGTAGARAVVNAPTPAAT